MSHISIIEEVVVPHRAAPGRGEPCSARLQEHILATAKQLQNLGIRSGDCVASLLPEGPDTNAVRMALAAFEYTSFVPFAAHASREQYVAWLIEFAPKLLLMHPANSTARQAARTLGVPVANVLRHFEAGVFTLESAAPLPFAPEVPPAPRKTRSTSVPLVLIAPGLAFRRLASRLDSHHPVIGITPPSLEHLPPPHTIEHVAAECVRMLRRYRPEGPYALAGWRTEGLVALEMARLLDEEGAHVAFVAMLDASELFAPSMSRVRRAAVSALKYFRKKPAPACEFMAQALRRYRPHPWFGKIMHIRPAGECRADPCFEWQDIAPHGFASYDAPAEMLAEANVQTVAGILAIELRQAPNETAHLET